MVITFKAPPTSKMGSEERDIISGMDMTSHNFRVSKVF